MSRCVFIHVDNWTELITRQHWYIPGRLDLPIHTGSTSYRMGYQGETRY